MLIKLTDRIYYMPNDDRTDRPILGLVCGDKYSLVVDSGNSPAHANEFLADVCKLDIPPLKYLVLTHWHWDHVFGIEAMNIITICNYLTKENLNKMQKMTWDDFMLDERVEKGEEIEFCSKMIKLEMPDRDGFKTGNADLTFKDSIEIDLGGISCLIETVGGCHSEDSTIIYIPDEKTIFLGDCICEDIYSGEWSYSREKLMPMINKIKKYDALHYLTSHHHPESKEEFFDYLNELIRIGDFVGNGYLENEVIRSYTEFYNKAPNEDEICNIRSFIHGNMKNI
ncbi:MBL fold metallo-hydrolase [Aminipila terrae]|uniref:MBL fold metallo-hydrolase n=1 Tax=Aminipila terrae TaxID=2697030 RepID=A0A6P1MHD1_9FIRM|nr:MBL fold metallo-hydrolase [Aminipila terrae]QHI70996.1 MBL fold metallo-hydrolase [Aminipila terrae]